MAACIVATGSPGLQGSRNFSPPLFRCGRSGAPTRRNQGTLAAPSGAPSGWPRASRLHPRGKMKHRRPCLPDDSEDGGSIQAADEEVTDLGVKAALSMLKFYKREISPLLPSSDEEDEGTTVGPAAKRVRSEGYPQPVLPPSAVHRREFGGACAPSGLVSAEGRYVSKRERARLAAEASSSSGVTELNTPVSTSVMTPEVRSISDLDVPHNALPISRDQVKENVRYDKESRKPTIALSGHKKAVNAVQWSRSHAHLLASAGMDQTVCVWNVWSQENQRARVLTHHTAAVKDVRWSPRGLSLLSCGYDCCSRMVDVNRGVEEQVFKEDQVVDVIKFHPDNPNLFLSGGFKGSLRLWDIRTGNVAQEYIKPLGPILDVDFSSDGRHFISSSDVSQRNASENSIIVWDVSRQVPLSNQVYVEAYTCPCVRYHPWESCFVAQSNGNYVAIFSGKAPFKLDRYRRFEGHWVSGFPVKCDFSADGNVLGSGSADGAVYLYSFHSSELLRKMDAFGDACVDVAFHPAVDGVVAACGWDGRVAVFQ